jgi:hypothetical protein
MTKARLDLRTCWHVTTTHLYWSLIWQNTISNFLSAGLSELAWLNDPPLTAVWPRGYGSELHAQRTITGTDVKYKGLETLLIHLMPEFFWAKDAVIRSAIALQQPQPSSEKYDRFSAWTMCQNVGNFPNPENYEASGTINVRHHGQRKGHDRYSRWFAPHYSTVCTSIITLQDIQAAGQMDTAIRGFILAL